MSSSLPKEQQEYAAWQMSGLFHPSIIDPVTNFRRCPPCAKRTQERAGKPGILNLIDFSYRISGDLPVVEMFLDYDGNRINVCETVDFEARVASAVGRKSLERSR